MRTALIFFDMADSSGIPPAAEPFFMGLGAKITFAPVMNAEEMHAPASAGRWKPSRPSGWAVEERGLGKEVSAIAKSKRGSSPPEGTVAPQRPGAQASARLALAFA